MRRRPVSVLALLIGALGFFVLPGVAFAHGPQAASLGEAAWSRPGLGAGQGLAPVAAAQGSPLYSASVAGQAATDEARNFSLLANVAPPAHTPIGGTDLAFWGTRAYAGSFGGFRIIDVADPSNPTVLGDVQCEGVQGDVAVWRNKYVVVSVDDPMTSPTCDGVGTDFASTPDAWEGIRIFDVSNPRRPRYLTAVATDCGSHTHTLVPDPANDRVLIYVSSFNIFQDGPNCPAATPAHPVSHSKISIVEVPFDNPAAAAVISEPGAMFDGGQPCTDTPYNPLVPSDQFFACNDTDDGVLGISTRGCHDIQVLLDEDLAACSALSEGQIWDISDRAAPRLIKRLDNPNFEAWHNAVFTWDGKYVLFTDEAGIGVEPWCKPGDPDTIGANWIYRVKGRSTRPVGHFKSPRTIVSSRPEAMYCTAHNGTILPVRDRYLHVQAYYGGGTSLTDFTNPARPREVAYFHGGDATPFDAPLTFSVSWSSYFYRGAVYANDLARGVDVLRWRDPASRRAVWLDHDNPQTQERILFRGRRG